jgi:hypothetical protein
MERQPKVYYLIVSLTQYDVWYYTTQLVRENLATAINTSQLSARAKLDSFRQKKKLLTSYNYQFSFRGNMYYLLRIITVRNIGYYHLRLSDLRTTSLPRERAVSFLCDLRLLSQIKPTEIGEYPLVVLLPRHC